MAPENGMIYCLLGDDGVATNGDTCIVTCNNRFTLSGDATRTCRIKRHKMNWSGKEARCVEGMHETLTITKQWFNQCKQNIMGYSCRFSRISTC